MSNGTACCAAEICCNGAEARAKVVKAVAEFTGAEPQYCEGFLDWMKHEGLIFADESLRQFVQQVTAQARKHVEN